MPPDLTPTDSAELISGAEKTVAMLFSVFLLSTEKKTGGPTYMHCQ
jgi:hypothetical protein